MYSKFQFKKVFICVTISEEIVKPTLPETGGLKIDDELLHI